MDYFKPYEFTMGNENVFDQMDTDFLNQLDEARSYSVVPWIITSSYRTVAYSQKKGYSITSSHTKGLAVDISAPNSTTRWEIVNALLKAGFNRIGIGEDFVHVDMDTDKAPNVIWTYY